MTGVTGVFGASKSLRGRFIGLGGQCTLQTLVDLLVVVNGRAQRGRVIEFQRLVWDATELDFSSEQVALVRDLAHDLDFCEPGPAARAEDSSYFGDERAEASSARRCISSCPTLLSRWASPTRLGSWPPTSTRLDAARVTTRAESLPEDWTDELPRKEQGGAGAAAV